LYPRLLGISLTFTLFLFLDTLVNRFSMHIECGTVVYYLQIHISVVWCCIIYLIMLFITRKDIITVFEWALQEFSFVAACRRIVKKIKFVSTLFLFSVKIFIDCKVIVTTCWCIGCKVTFTAALWCRVNGSIYFFCTLMHKCKILPLSKK